MAYKFCRICGSKKIEGLRNVKGYQYCRNCHTAWLIRSKKTIYEEEYFKPRSRILSFMAVPVFNFFYSGRTGYTNGSAKNTWVDVGAGKGEFLSTVSAKRRIGVEISKLGLTTMSKRGLDTLSTYKFLKSSGLNADIISFWHVLEHVETPWEFLKVAARNLKKNGKIVIAVPNIESLEFKLFGRHWFHLAPKYHLWHFSINSLKLLLEKTGLKIKKIDYWATEHHLTGLVQSFINRSTGTDSILHKLVKRRTELTRISINDMFWIIFWTTVGFPVVLIFWITSALTRKPGTLVLVAQK